MAVFIEDKPAITDDDLQILLARARRWGRGGNARQKAAVAELLPAVQALIEARATFRKGAGYPVISRALH